MPLIERWIDPNVAPGGDGSSGNPYSSPVEWDAAEQTDLVSSGDQHIVYLRSGSYTGPLLLDSWVTSVANNISILAEAGHEHLGVLGAGFFWDNTTGFAATLDCRQDGTVLEDFSLSFSGSSNGTRVLYVNTASNVTVRRMFLGPMNFGNQPIVHCVSGADDLTMESCVVYRSWHDGVKVTNFLSATLRNCTIYGPRAIGYNKEGLSNPDSIVHNTVSANNVTDFAPGDTTGSHNAASDGTQIGPDGIPDITDADFENPGNDDFRIPSTSSKLYNAGTAAELPALDITKRPFTQPDIGAYAFIVAGPPDLALDWTVAGEATVDWDLVFEAPIADLPLDTTLLGEATIEWDMSQDVPLATSFAGVGTASEWNLDEEGAQLFPLATTLAGIGTAFGWDAGVEFTMAATWPGASSQDWSVSTELALATTLTGAGTINWSAGLVEPLATTLAGAGTIDWSIEGQDGLVAQLNGVATAFDSDLGWEALLASTLTGAATIDWSIVQEVPGDEALIATFVGEATTPGWSAIPELPLVASLPGVGTADAWNLSLDSDLTLATTLAGIGTAVGWSAGLEQTLATTLPGVGTQTWDLAGDETLALTLQGIATPDWFGSLDFPLFITLPGLTNIDDWSISRGGLDIPIFATAVRDVTPWPTVVEL